jgi:AcrR family transcriptional regulator
MSTLDRRVVRTRRMVRRAFLELVGEKPYEKITVRDIANRADIGYATFFRHYDGVDGLMLEITLEIIQELETSAGQEREDYFEREGRLIFQQVAREPSLFRGILGSHAFRRRLRDHVQATTLAHLKNHAALVEPTPIPLEIAASHMVSSLFGLIDWWLDHRMEPPIERMAAMYERLIIRATWQALTPGLKLRLPWESGRQPG